MPPPFPNKYKKSQVKTEKDCWTCRKTTFTCLLTDNYASGGDFLYTCDAHLKDRNFASPIIEAAPPIAGPAESGPSQAEIDQAVKEYNERKKAKEEKGKDAEKADSKYERPAKDSAVKAKSAGEAKADLPAPVPPPEPTHFQLHKHFYDMRLRMRVQQQQHRDAQARKSQLDLPSAPTSRPTRTQ